MIENTQASPAERRREKQRQHIIAQARDIYVENGGENGGFENTTVEAIAERSDISLRTFFRYFESKLDVIYLDSRQAAVDLEKFIVHRLLEEPPILAALNGRLDQLRSFCSDQSSRERLCRALGAPQFRDRMHILRGNSEMLVVRLIAPHLDGARSVQMRQAGLVAIATTAIISPLLNPKKLVSRTDFEAEANTALEEFRSILSLASPQSNN